MALRIWTIGVENTNEGIVLEATRLWDEWQSVCIALAVFWVIAVLFLSASDMLLVASCSRDVPFWVVRTSN